MGSATHGRHKDRVRERTAALDRAQTMMHHRFAQEGLDGSVIWAQRQHDYATKSLKDALSCMPRQCTLMMLLLLRGPFLSFGSAFREAGTKVFFHLSDPFRWLLPHDCGEGGLMLRLNVYRVILIYHAFFCADRANHRSVCMITSASLSSHLNGPTITYRHYA
jgi:hypothetical protein